MIVVDGEEKEWNKEMTIASLLKTLNHVEFCSVVRINGKLVSSPDFSKTLIPDKAEIQLLPLVAGG